MAKAIYEIKLNDRYFPAQTPEEALERWCDCTDRALSQADVEIQEVCKEQDTMKLFQLAKVLYDMEKFDFREVSAAVSAVALQLEYYANYQNITDCIMTWVERFDDMSLADLEEWIID